MLSLPERTRVHDRYLALRRIGREHFADSVGGKLLLRSGFDADGVAAVIAASVAGAGSLCVDAEGERLRAGLRAGLIDFVVGNLDEALRILKNEIRRKLPVSVGLTADPEASIAEMVARGLQPDFLSGSSSAHAGVFLERGAVALVDHEPTDPETSLIEWTVVDDSARSMARLAQVASSSLDVARNDTAVRRRWLEQSPRYLGRAFGSRQCVRMTELEAAAFISLARKEVSGVTITTARNGQSI